MAAAKHTRLPKHSDEAIQGQAAKQAKMLAAYGLFDALDDLFSALHMSARILGVECLRQANRAGIWRGRAIRAVKHVEHIGGNNGSEDTDDEDDDDDDKSNVN